MSVLIYLFSCATITAHTGFAAAAGWWLEEESSAKIWLSRTTTLAVQPINFHASKWYHSNWRRATHQIIIIIIVIVLWWWTERWPTRYARPRTGQLTRARTKTSFGECQIIQYSYHNGMDKIEMRARQATTVDLFGLGRTHHHPQQEPGQSCFLKN